jgi:MFS family permease
MADSKRKDIEGFPSSKKDNPQSEIGNRQSNGRVGYLEVLRSNRDFRNLWLGQVVSELGDWFSIIALFNLLLQLTNRAQSVGWFLIIIHLPSVIVGPVAGLLIDRLDRKRLMIWMDAVRAVLVLGYLLVNQAHQIWIVYLTATLEVAILTVFEPARTALVPNICRPRELVAANAISSVTWSAMLTIGAAAGGFVAAVFGRQVCYVLNSLSFVISALFISRVRNPSRPGAAERRPATGMGLVQATTREIQDGFRYLRAHPPVLALLLVKMGWGLGGGILLVLSVFGEKIFPIMGSGAAGIGVLYASRGFGTALGPIAARRLAGERPASMRNAIAVGFFMGSLFYLSFGQAPWLPLAALALIFAHMGGSVTWVFSTVMLQLEVPDEFRGRVFAAEFALLTLGIALSNYFTGYWLDVVGFSPRTVATLLGIYFALPGFVWIAAQRVFRK